eukprot:TRINITY_DN32405_c0_g1_i1.p1 TRINITY_DN32405_c0_g1~~TRINITY_DN32405_c0_g1_i1.p1  ORF type:complete len:493 (-),score=75.39 TRINITY_DN32405_c0_g1_i1:130-1581(-)
MATRGWPRTLKDLSRLEHACISFLQFALHYVLPYFIISRLSWYIGLPFPWTLAFVVELVFYMWMTMCRLPRLHAAPLIVDKQAEDPLKIFETSLERVKAIERLGYSSEKWLSGWFLGADPLQIRRGNLTEWIAHMFFAKELSSLQESEQATMQLMVDQLCSWLGLSPELGYSQDVHSIRFLHQPLFILQRSLLMYMLTSALPRLGVFLALRLLGLQRVRCAKTGLYYWWRTSPNLTIRNFSEILEPDLLFFHGLCGLTGYLPLLVMLLRDPARGAVLIELEDISQCLNVDRWPNRKAVIETARDAFDHLQSLRRGVRRSCIVVSHSLGTVPGTWMMEEPPAKIAGAVFMDPIVSMVELPDIAHSFLYRVPRSAFEWMCFLWCTTEPGIAFHFRRRFFWYQNRLDPRISDSVPTLLCLSEKDQIVPSTAVRAFAAEAMPRAEVKWWEGLGHTYFMGSLKCQAEVAQWVSGVKLRADKSAASIGG